MRSIKEGNIKFQDPHSNVMNVEYELFHLLVIERQFFSVLEKIQKRIEKLFLRKRKVYFFYD